MYMSVCHFRYALLFVQSILLDASVERTVGNAELLCRLLAVATIALKCFLHNVSANVVEIETVVVGGAGVVVVVYFLCLDILKGVESVLWIMILLYW